MTPGLPASVQEEVAQLRRWKEEALEVILGLQDLGKALGIPLGERITGRSATEAALHLTQRVRAVEELHVPWYEVNGVRHDNLVHVSGEDVPPDHICRVGPESQRCEIDPDALRPLGAHLGQALASMQKAFRAEAAAERSDYMRIT